MFFWGCIMMQVTRRPWRIHSVGGMTHLVIQVLAFEGEGITCSRRALVWRILTGQS